MAFSAEDQTLIKVWSANSLDLNQIDYCIWGTTAACLPQPDSWRGWAEVTLGRRVGTIPAVSH